MSRPRQRQTAAARPCAATAPGRWLALALGGWLGVALLLPCAPAHAGGGGGGVGSLVHDPTAYVQHVRSVQSALAAEAQRAQQLHQQWQSLLLQVRQHETMLSQLARIRAEDLLPARIMSAENLRRAGEYLQRIDLLGGSLERLRSEAVRTQQAHALSRLTWPEYVERERALARVRLDRNQALFADALDSMRRVETDYAEVRAVQARIPHSEGSHQSLQMLNHQMSLLIAQNAALQARLAERDAQQAQAASADEALAAGAQRRRELELQDADLRTQRAREAAQRARARAAEAIEARRLGR